MSMPISWSATPTPFLNDRSLDLESVDRLVQHHEAMGMGGLMLGGTCGEGPWMPQATLCALVKRAKAATAGRLKIAAQVTDNSSDRMLAHINAVAEAGADYAVIATPGLVMNATPQRILETCRETICRSPIPAAYYERGKHGQHAIAIELLPELLAESNLHWIKDSSSDPERQRLFLDTAAARPGLSIFNGNEFECDTTLAAGYHGTVLGGAIFNHGLLLPIVEAVKAGDAEKAKQLQERMNELMFRVYGGPKITCWLTGLKYLLTRMGIFSTSNGYLGYPLTDECKAAIDEIIDGPDRDGFRPQLFPA